jgi:hypothetical protein
MTFAEVESFVARITYKPQSTLTVWKNSSCDGISLLFTKYVVDVADNSRVIPLVNSYSSTYLPRDQEELIHMINTVVRTLELHEINEWLKLDGRCVVEPHPELKKESA